MGFLSFFIDLGFIFLPKLDDISGPLIEPMSEAEQESLYEQATAAEKQGEFETAFGLWKSLGDRGNPVAQYKLGFYYFNGQGTLKNLTWAEFWYKKAGMQGIRDAQYELASMYFNGKAGGSPDFSHALEWYLQAAAQGDPRAQAALGEMYLKGLGTLANDVVAYKWSSLAAEAGNSAAAQNRESAAARMSSEKIDEAKALADEWRTDHDGSVPDGVVAGTSGSD